MSRLNVYAPPKREMTFWYRARSVRLVTVLFVLDFLAMLLPRPRRNPPTDRPIRLLIANWGHLGDVVTILPLISYLQQRPEIGKVDLLIGSWARGVIETTDLGVDIHVADHWSLNRGGGSLWRRMLHYFSSVKHVVGELRSGKYDVSIDTFSTFPSTHGITWAAGIPCRIGFNSGGLGTLLTDPAAWRAEDCSLLSQQLGLLRPLLSSDLPESLSAVYPGYQPVALPGDIVLGQRTVALHVGAGNPRKYWGEAEWVELAKCLSQDGYTVIITGGGGTEAETARTIAVASNVQCAAGRLSWRQLVTLVASSVAVVTHDTVVGHLAACFNIPTVVLTPGQLRLSYWHPNNTRAIVLSHPVGCYPCNRTEGCASMACIRLISVEDVMAGLRSVVASPERTGLAV